MFLNNSLGVRRLLNVYKDNETTFILVRLDVPFFRNVFILILWLSRTLIAYKQQTVCNSVESFPLDNKWTVTATELLHSDSFVPNYLSLEDKLLEHRFQAVAEGRISVALKVYKSQRSSA